MAAVLICVSCHASPGGGPAFAGNYATRDFSQWPEMQNVDYVGRGSVWTADYPATIVEDPVKGPVARYEVRSGDVPSFGGGERSEASSAGAYPSTGGSEGDLMWYSFSVKFDQTYPSLPAIWQITNQWHTDQDNGSPSVSFNVFNDDWQLYIQRQDSPGQYVSFDVPWATPVDRGRWHDVKIGIRWSVVDDVGTIQLWHDGKRQLFSDGSDTWHSRTMVPGASTVYYKEGLYRAPMAATGVVFHTGFRSSAVEADV